MLEAYVEILAILATLFGTVMSVANFPQTYRIIKRKSSSDVSILTYMMLTPGTLLWVLYGISLGNLPIIIVNSIGSIGIISVIIVYMIYKK